IIVEEEGTRIAVRMPGAAAPETVAVAAAPVAAVAPAETSAASAAAPANDRPASWKAVEAPMVGTFYSAPSPGEPPFVAVEMGTIREVCVEDASPVEFGTVLFYVEPLGTPAPAPETA
ncbi:MAG: pyruvate carboxylase subunit B, partial [Raoultibacter sp.]